MAPFWYHKSTKGVKGHGLGAPHVYQFMAVLKCLAVDDWSPCEGGLVAGTDGDSLVRIAEARWSHSKGVYTSLTPPSKKKSTAACPRSASK